MNEKEVRDFIFDTRTWYFKSLGVKVPLSKQLNFDLLVKYCILCLNSLGRQRINEIVFLDEVANKNMSDNLRITMSHCENAYSIMNFFTIEKEKFHVKLGYLRPLFFALWTILDFVGNYLLMPFSGMEKTRRATSDRLERMFMRYLKNLYGKAKSIYCMTDHNYYSTIACVDKNFFSSVIQHGLWLSDDLGEQIIADRLCVWGKRSKEVIKSKKCKDVTGTYKFDRLLEIGKKSECLTKGTKNNNVVLYCISILDQVLVMEKIQSILEIVKRYGYDLKVKTHPGFGFSVEDLIKGFPEIEFYKECVLSDIGFSIGICENSTVLLDIMCLQKKYIIFDTDTSYFGIYEDIIPWAKTSEELDILFKDIDSYDYETARQKIFKYELNSNVCTIFEKKRQNGYRAK